jgi:hypothetical protein
MDSRFFRLQADSLQYLLRPAARLEDEMPDMLVNLLRLPPLEPLLSDLSEQGVTLRRAQPWEVTKLQNFVKRRFSQPWADEASVGFTRQPVSVYMALRHTGRDAKVIGFAAYECTRRGFFGPTGVVEEERGCGVGRALLIASLKGLREMGYVYGIIGGVGPIRFYEEAVGATVIADSSPGIYADPLEAEMDEKAETR